MDRQTTHIPHENGNVYLKGGWEEFLKGNLVREYEMPTFAYLGNMKFLVRIFDISGLEKMSINILEKKKTSPTVKKKFGKICFLHILSTSFLQTEIVFADQNIDFLHFHIQTVVNANKKSTLAKRSTRR